MEIEGDFSTENWDSEGSGNSNYWLEKFASMGIDLETAPIGSEKFFQALMEVWPEWKALLSKDKPHEMVPKREQELLDDYLGIAEAVDKSEFNAYELHIEEMPAILSETDAIFIVLILPEIEMEIEKFRKLGKSADRIFIGASDKPDKINITWIYHGCYQFTNLDNPPM